MVDSNMDHLAFIVHWLDVQAGVTWKYQLTYHASDKSLEMYDIKNRRTFLKRTEYPSVKPEHLYIGSIITVYSRQLHLMDYADEHTRKKLDQKRETTLAMIKPDAIEHIGKILNAIYGSGFLIKRMKMCHLSLTEAQQFYAVHQARPFFRTLTEFMSSGRVFAMELVTENAIAKWRKLIGPTNSDTARAEDPDSLRANFGTDNTMNACHGSDAPETAKQEVSFFFDRADVGRCAQLRDCSLAIVKPHAVTAGHAGAIIDQIAAHFEITALQQHILDQANAVEFLEVYKGVVPEYNGLVDELKSGPLIALEVTSRDGSPDVVQELREFCGPADPEIGKVLRPQSLRAQFGIDKVKNAVHCTDLPEDGPLESNFFFDILLS
ncbi:Nucleoside diphosphate kinase [Klebsormidium nitens]|uniref:Nucleoside diphosphate kinase n=1 Tax=Klebsormidium nitens TaxID=105231 RepID=A0A1Y1HIV6_KLENI|nr:Nucleoside diphosphate kinase [Klebsormidium nitens]|eukprot:GAQ77823.1 Nucleoside diphosphate kinase [Klebsormidium nitens]